MSLAYSHSPFITYLRQLPRKPRTGTGSTTLCRFILASTTHIIRQAVIGMRVQIGAQLVRGHLPIHRSCYIYNVICTNATLAAINP